MEKNENIIGGIEVINKPGSEGCNIYEYNTVIKNTSKIQKIGTSGIERDSDILKKPKKEIEIEK